MGRRKVIRKDTPDNYTLLENVSENKYYGTISNYGKKGFITRQKYNGGNFVSLCFDAITKGNGFGMANGYETLKTAIDALIGGPLDVYEFDTWKELLKWLAEDLNGS